MLLRVEFHCHTIYSKDCLTSLESVLAACRTKNIHRVVITDHNTILGAERARQLDSVRVIVGEEVMTQGGELLSFFLQEEIPPGLTPLKAINLMREQGAFIGVAHPFDSFRKGHWDLNTLKEIVPLVDAIETFNARSLWSGFNARALAFARQNGLTEIVGSDAHTPFEIGNATLLLPHFNDAASLKNALQLAKRKVSLSWPWVHFFSRIAVWRKRISSGSQPNT